MSYNIRFGGIGREKLIASVINECGPDIVIFQEADRRATIEQIAGLIQMPSWAARDGHSLGFASRVPIDRFEWKPLRGLQRSILEILPSGTTSRIIGVHLRAIHSNLTERRRMREVKAVLSSIDRDGPHLLTGDFNTLAPGEKLLLRHLPARLQVLAVLLGGRPKFRAIAMILDAGYADGYRSLHADEGFTFPTWSPHVRLDYVFLSPPLRESLSTCAVIREAAGAADASDHFPLVFDVDLP